jgi:hypothetical protein
MQSPESARCSSSERYKPLPHNIADINFTYNNGEIIRLLIKRGKAISI